ncbi:hypothetical protein AX15_006152 [Amanita polypyramis BW_CC]|nr:hypothetical protein AX15_006152 [Amanita polypyramis BW_CC]
MRINYLILDEPNVDYVQSVEIDSSDTVISLRTKIASNHHLLVPGQIVKFEKVFMSMDDEEINDKLRDFTFTPTGNAWRATTKLSTVIVPADLAPDHLHLIIRPAFINVNYVFPSISPEVSLVRIAYSGNVKELLKAILVDMGLNVNPRQYTILKTSIDIDVHLPSRIATAKGQELAMSQKLLEVFDKVPNHKYVHVIVKPRLSEPGSVRAVAEAPVSELSRRHHFLALRHAEAPSSGGQPKVFAEKQATDAKIMCGRPQETSAPIPLTLLHPIFAKFVDDCEHSQPSRQINQFTLKLAASMSKFYPDEKARTKELKLLFSDLGIDLQTIRITGTVYETDAALIKGNKFLLVCGEIKNNAANNVDPFLQAILYYLEQTREVAPTFPLSVLPAIILICAGPYLSFAGAVWNGRPNVQILTPAIPLHFHSTDLKLRKMTASCISAFSSAVQSLKAHYNEPFYHQTSTVDDIYPSVHNIFPYPVSFKSDISGSSKEFIYYSLVKSGKLIFRGEISDTHEKICIKFVQHYSLEVHSFCASISCAPKLLAFEPLPGGWYMVIMEDLNDYFDLFRSSLAPDRMDAVKERLNDVLGRMHQQGFVHGDIRNVNVMIKDGPILVVMLVDFDWAGRIGEARYPMNVNREDVYRPAGAVDNELILAEHDMSMLAELTC